MARRIVITSGKGGVGKTTIVANLGARLASLGFRVLLFDVDIGLNNLDVVMGIEKKILFDVVDVIDGRCRARQALVQDSRFPSLYVMTSVHNYGKISISGQQIKKVVDELSASFDYVLIDCPAGIDGGFHRAVFSATEAIVVVTPHISSVRDADKVLSVLSGYDVANRGIIINRVRGDLMLSGEMMDVEAVTQTLKLQLLGVIPEDDGISTLSSIGGLIGGNYAGRAFTLLAENIHQGSRKIYDCTLRYRGFFGNFRRNLKRKV